MTTAVPTEATAHARHRRPYATVLDTIGWTPLIRLNRITRGVRTPVFAKADFFAIYDREKEILGPSLITREEYTLTPGETEDLKFEVNREARFLGVLAAYRDPSAHWRAISPAPEKGLADLVKKDRLTVTLGKNAVSLAIKD